ncbi:LuxR C-terminal-related transcriptional regulator [Nocardia sp. NPDC058658]|uniref:helix-turn-helix transcriptional regulator n=1 Tax=Nocardia sp. NPDC058658 TaxID=3346580 RepID=UPI003659ECD5
MPYPLARCSELLGRWALRSYRNDRSIQFLCAASQQYIDHNDTHSSQRVAALLGEAYRRAGELDLANESLTLALRAPDRDGTYEVETSTAATTIAMIALSDPEKCDERSWSQLHRQIRQLEGAADRLVALTALGHIGVNLGRPDRALALFHEALRDPAAGICVFEAIAALEGCAAAYTAAGSDYLYTAATLLTATRHLRPAYGLPARDDFQVDSDSGTLSEDTFREVEAIAATMRLDDAIAYSLSVELAPSSETDPLAVLTKRQREVARLVATGMTNRMVATRLGIAEWTVVNHLRQVMSKLGCASRLHVALMVERAADTQRGGRISSRRTGSDPPGEPRDSRQISHRRPTEYCYSRQRVGVICSIPQQEVQRRSAYTAEVPPG